MPFFQVEHVRGATRRPKGVAFYRSKSNPLAVAMAPQSQMVLYQKAILEDQLQSFLHICIFEL